MVPRFTRERGPVVPPFTLGEGPRPVLGPRRDGTTPGLSPRTRRPRAQRRGRWYGLGVRAQERSRAAARDASPTHDRPPSRWDRRRLRYCEVEGRRGATQGHG